MHRMLELRHDVFFYITVMNQNHAQPSLPTGVEPRVCCAACTGCRRRPTRWPRPWRAARWWAVARSCTKCIEAANWLAAHWQVQADLCSATSFSELAREGQSLERTRVLGGETTPLPWATQVLQGTHGPIVVATDYVRAVAEQLRALVPAGRRCVTLGTDGFGRSDSRALLREFFEVSPHHIVLRALQALADGGEIDAAVPIAARQRYGLAAGPDPWSI